MAFTIPNKADAGFAYQSAPDSVDFDILVAAYGGSGTVSACAVTAQGTPDMTVAVASGTVIVDGVRVAVTGANSTIGTADTTNPRIDLITVNNSGTITTTAGTAASVPALPAIPANSVVLAAVYVGAGDTDIDSNQITDKRMLLANTAAAGAADDVLVRLGDDGDAVLVLRSTALTATSTLANVVEGTAATLGTAANSLIIANATNDGDIHLIVSKAGNSHTAFLADGSTGDTYVNAATGQVVNLAVAATAEVAVSGTAMYPVTDDGQILGILDTNEWSDLFLASGGVIGWSNNNVTLTHSASTLTLAGGSFEGTLGAVTLAGAVTGGDQAFTAVGDMTFTAGSILRSGSTNTDTLLLRANDTTFITLTTGATDVCTMDTITASGTWLASGTWTLPAITLGGAVSAGDQAFTGVGDMTFTAASLLRSGSTNTDTLLIAANDTTFITLTTAATDVCTLEAVTLKGTLLADGTVTMPALTLGGAIAGGDVAFTGVGDMTFTSGSLLRSGDTNTDTLLIAANDTTFITLTTAATDTITFAGAVISGQTALAVSPASSDELLINDGGTIKKITADDFMFGDASTPSTQAHGDAAATGTAIEAARIDHKHAMPAGGGVSQADQAALEAETNEDTYAPPDLIRHSPGVAKVWVKWEQSGANSIQASYNMTSATDGGAVGDTDLLWNTDFSGAEYVIVAGSDDNLHCIVTASTLLGAGVTMETSKNTDNTMVDSDHNFLAAYGDQ